MDPQKLEEFYARRIGLPNVGLDPSKDCHHVRDDELTWMFGEKKRYMGYNFLEAKSPRVRDRVKELLPPIWQSPLKADACYIPESFARAVVSEVCHHTQMNWARYASHRGKVSAKVGEGEYFYGTKGQTRYADLVIRRISEEIVSAEEELQHTSAAELSQKHEVENLRAKQPQDPREQLKVQLELQSLNGKLLSATGLVDSWRKSRASVEECGSEDLSLWYEQRIECEVKVIAALEDSIRRLKEESQDSATELLEASEEEKSLSAMKIRQTVDVERRKTLLLTVQTRANIALTRTPSPIIEEKESTPETHEIVIQPCALCRSGFPNFDIVVAPCLCIYHPWCVGMQCWLEENCANPFCKDKFPESWLRSFGLYRMEGMSSSTKCFQRVCLFFLLC